LIRFCIKNEDGNAPILRSVSSKLSVLSIPKPIGRENPQLAKQKIETLYRSRQSGDTVGPRP
jgi:hypothetical protein